MIYEMDSTYHRDVYKKVMEEMGERMHRQAYERIADECLCSSGFVSFYLLDDENDDVIVINEWGWGKEDNFRQNKPFDIVEWNHRMYLHRFMPDVSPDGTLCKTGEEFFCFIRSADYKYYNDLARFVWLTNPHIFPQVVWMSPREQAWFLKTMGFIRNPSLQQAIHAYIFKDLIVSNVGEVFYEEYPQSDCYEFCRYRDQLYYVSWCSFDSVDGRPSTTG